MSRIVPSYTILDPAISDISQLVIRKELVDNGQGGTTEELRVTAYYTLKASVADVDVDQKFESYSVRLAGAAKTSMVNYVNANIIPGIKAQEGL